MFRLICQEAVGTPELLRDVVAVNALTGGALHPLPCRALGYAGVAVLAIVVTLAS